MRAGQREMGAIAVRRATHLNSVLSRFVKQILLAPFPRALLKAHHSGQDVPRGFAVVIAHLRAV